MKNLKKLGKVLSSKEQKSVNGGKAKKGPCKNGGDYLGNMSEQECSQWGNTYSHGQCWMFRI